MKTEEIKAMVETIQTIKNGVEVMKSQKAIMELEQLNEIIPFAVKVLEFESIQKNGLRHDDEGEFIVDEDGIIVKGVLLYASIEDTVDTDEGFDVTYKEVFLLSDGTFRTFDTIYSSIDCSDCGCRYTFVDRDEAIEECTSEHKNERILENIHISLREQVSNLEQNKAHLVARLDELKSKKVS